MANGTHTGKRPQMNRRELMRDGSVWMAGASMIPTLLRAQQSPAAAAPAITPVMAKLSAYMAEAKNVPLPDEVTEKAKQHILDTFAAMISGAICLRDASRSSLRVPYGGEKVATVAAPTSFAARSRPRLPTACWRIPTKPTTRMRLAIASRLRRRSRGTRRRRAIRHRRERDSCAPSRWATTSAARHHDSGRRALRRSRAIAAPTASRKFRRRRGRRMRGGPERPANALAARLRRAAGRRHRRLGTRHRAHRERLRLRRHARAQRGHRRPAGSIGLDRRRRHILRAR